MSPTTLLRLWRERWGLSEGTAAGASHAAAMGRPPLAGGLSEAPLWSVRGASLAAFALAVPLFALAVLVPTDLPGQSAFGLALLVVAFAVRRHAGRLASLVLVGLCALAGARYLVWRWGATLPDPPLALPGRVLWLAEATAWATLLLWMGTRLAPVARRSSVSADIVAAGHTMQDDAAHVEAPYVDVVVIAGHSDAGRVRRLVAAALAQQWPAERLRVFLQDADGLHAWRGDGARIAFAPPPVAVAAPHLPAGNGAFILQVEADGPEGQLDDPALLAHWMAWMQREPALAMLHGGASPLAPPACGPARAQLQAGAGAGASLLRRAAVAALPPGTGAEPLAARLQQQGHRTALMGLAAADGGTGMPGEWLRIDAADHADTLRRRLRLQSLLDSLRRPARLALRAMALAALALPTFGLLLVQAPLSWCLAYALPYAALAFLTWARAVAPARQPLMVELRDWMLALVLPLVTALQVLVATRRAEPGVRSHPSGRRDILLSWLYIAILVVGMARLVGASPALRPWLVAGCLGVGYAVLLRVSAWAVAEERRALRAEQAAMRFQPAELQVAGEAPAEVEIVNFPEHPLRLRLPPSHGMQLEAAAASLRLRNAPDVVLRGDIRPAHDGGPAFCADSHDAGRLSAIAVELQMRYLARHRWLPGSRLGAVLRRLLPLRMHAAPRDATAPAAPARSPFPHRSSP